MSQYNFELENSPAWAVNSVLDNCPLQHAQLVRELADDGVSIIASYSEGVWSRKKEYHSLDLLDMRFLSDQGRLELYNKLQRMSRHSGMVSIKTYPLGCHGTMQMTDRIAATWFPAQLAQEYRVVATRIDRPGTLLHLEDALGKQGFSLNYRKCFLESPIGPDEPPLFKMFVQAEHVSEVTPQILDLDELATKHQFTLDVQPPWSLDETESQMISSSGRKWPTILRGAWNMTAILNTLCVSAGSG